MTHFPLGEWREKNLGINIFFVLSVKNKQLKAYQKVKENSQQ